jgi:hypothetical protein
MLLFTLLYIFCKSFRFSSHFYFIRSSSRHHKSLSCRGSCSPSWSDTTWPREGRPRRSRRCPWLPLELTEPNSLFCQTRPSNLPSFKQELSALVHFMCEHILMTPMGNRLLQAHQVWRVETPVTRIRSRQGQHPQAHLRHLDEERSQGVQNVSRQSWGALPFALRGDTTRDCSQGHYADRLHQARGNTWDTA